MAGFSSIDDWINEVTVNGKFWRADWQKLNGAGVYTAGRWYDMSGLGGTPQALQLGEMVWNRFFTGGANFWTLTTGWAWSADTMLKSGDGLGTLSQTMQKAPVAGRSYRVIYTVSSRTAGSVTVSVGGTAGTTRSANGTFTETLVATNTDGLVFTPTDTARFTIDNVSVVEVLQSFTLDDTLEGAMYHGGNVSPDYKSILNAMMISATATLHPSMWMLCDFLMCYPGINMNTATLQTLLNANTLPRYADGKGVRAFLVIQTASGATAHNLLLSYTNTTPTSGRTLPVTVACTASAIVGHITHAGVAANNYGPFLPLQAGDVGITSVQSLQLSAASLAGEASLVLCRPLLTLPMTAASVAAERDLMNQLPSLPRVYDGACLGLLHFAGGAVVANATAYGSFDFCWG